MNPTYFNSFTKLTSTYKNFIILKFNYLVMILILAFKVFLLVKSIIYTNAKFK